MKTSSSRNSPYAPIALRDESWWQVGRRAAQRGDVGADGSADDEAIHLETLRALYTPELLEKLQRRTPDKEARDTYELLFNTLELAAVIGQYELHGRQIFDLSSGVVHLLQHTDIRDCSLRNLQLPYPALYLHFGRQADLKVEGTNGEPEYIDGVLVAHAQGEGIELLRFATTSVDEAGNRVRRPCQFLSLNSEAMQMPVHSAISAGVAHLDDGSPPMENAWVGEFWFEMRKRAGDAVLPPCR